MTSTATKALQGVQLVTTMGLSAALINSGLPWWLLTTVFAWGLLAGTSGFSAGWDARGPG